MIGRNIIEELLPDWEIIEVRWGKEPATTFLRLKPPTPIESVDGVGGLRKEGDEWVGEEEDSDIKEDLRMLEAFRKNDLRSIKVAVRCKDIQDIYLSKYEAYKNLPEGSDPELKKKWNEELAYWEKRLTDCLKRAGI